MCRKLLYPWCRRETHKGGRNKMKDLFPEQYGLTGHELAAAAMVKFYINEVGAKAELKNIMGSEVDGAALADLFDRAAAYCVERTKGSNAAVLMQKVNGKGIVQNVSVEMLEFLMRLCEE
uniref:Uncharacterized protein n=1 Tax=Siphoviridae sp. ctvNP11 TaxID=2825721 RepID=A0A8S5PFH6_9CAUD|nr:MAG TPA: hypothetical protein [Siphoviridae sp. ctvNP11]